MIHSLDLLGNVQHLIPIFLTHRLLFKYKILLFHGLINFSDRIQYQVLAFLVINIALKMIEVVLIASQTLIKFEEKFIILNTV